MPPMAAPSSEIAKLLSGCIFRDARMNASPSDFVYGCGKRSRRLIQIFRLLACATSEATSSARQDRTAHVPRLRIKGEPSPEARVPAVACVLPVSRTCWRLGREKPAGGKRANVSSSGVNLTFDPTWLFLSLIPGGIGFVLMVYGKKQE